VVLNYEPKNQLSEYRKKNPKISGALKKQGEGNKSLITK